MADYEFVNYDVTDPVATIAMNRPERLNAWTGAMALEVQDAFERALDDRRVVGIILTGAGRGFCAGGDLKDNTLEGLKNSVKAPADAPRKPGLFELMRSMPKPVIAAVNGPAVGIGAVLSLWADLRFLSIDAFYTMAFSSRGTMAEGGSSWLLARLMGPAAALDMLMSSRRVGAEECLQLGLASRVTSAEELLPTAVQYIENLAKSCSPTAISMMKQQVYADLDDDLGGAAANSYQLLAEALERPDVKEGWTSFLEKRQPEFARIGS